MSAFPMRFLHAGQFNLHQPPTGFDTVPDPWRTTLRDAPCRAATQVVDTAIGEGVDFVLLSGTLCDPRHCEPHEMELLLSEFDRLAAQGIAVYWAAGANDGPEHWPEDAVLPDRVHVFPATGIGTWLHERDGRPIARISGTSRMFRKRVSAAKFPADPDGLFTIAACNAPADTVMLDGQQVDYFAPGGDAARRTPAASPRAAHHPGSPQGRSPAESGSHGCTVVEVEATGQIRTRFVPADVVRYVDQRISAADDCTEESLAQMLSKRIGSLAEEHAGRDVLVCWTVESAAPLLKQFNSHALADRLLEQIRAQFGAKPPGVYSVSLEIQPSSPLPEAWYQQETILGDFLRLVREHQNDESLPLDLSTYLSDRQLAGWIGPAAAELDGTARRRVLREAERLGANLLGGNENEL